MPSFPTFIEPSLVPAKDFNKIPHIDDQPALDPELAKEIGLIYQKHNVLELYGLHLLHRHYEITDNTVVHITAVDECIHVTKPSPADTVDLNNMRGRLYILNEAGKFQAYEYEPGPSSSFSESFLEDFADFIKKHNLRYRVALDAHAAAAKYPSIEFPAGSDATVTITGNLVEALHNTRGEKENAKKVGWKFGETGDLNTYGVPRLHLICCDIWTQCTPPTTPPTYTDGQIPISVY